VIWLYAVIDAYAESSSQISEFQKRRALSKNEPSFHYYPNISKDKVMLAVQISF